MKKVSPNPKYATDILPEDRFDEAIRKAVTSDPNLRLEYEKLSLIHWVSYITRKLREQNRMTQGELARMIDVPQSFISRLENPNSSKEPSLATLAKIAQVFGYRVAIDLERIPKKPGEPGKRKRAAFG